MTHAHGDLQRDGEHVSIRPPVPAERTKVEVDVNGPGAIIHGGLSCPPHPISGRVWASVASAAECRDAAPAGVDAAVRRLDRDRALDRLRESKSLGAGETSPFRAPLDALRRVAGVVRPPKAAPDVRSVLTIRRVLDEQAVNGVVKAWVKKATPAKPAHKKEVADAFGSTPFPQKFDTAAEVESFLDTKLQFYATGRTFQNELGVPFAGGLASPTVNISPPRSHAHERIPQMLKHISTILYDPLRLLSKTQEVECMFVNGTVVISSNVEKAIEVFMESAQESLAAAGMHPDQALLRQMVHTVIKGTEQEVKNADAKSEKMKVDREAKAKDADPIGTKPAKQPAQAKDGPNVGLDYRSGEFLGKLAQVTSGDRRPWDRDLEALKVSGAAPTEAQQRDADQAQDLARLIQTQSVEQRRYNHAETVALVNATPVGPPRIVFMHETDIHAEQQLLRVLIDSNAVAAHVTIRGAKRPCLGCSPALRYAKQHQGAVNIDFNPRPGLFWLNSYFSAIDAITARPGDLDLANAHIWVQTNLATMKGAGFYLTEEMRDKTDRLMKQDRYQQDSRNGGEADAATDSDSELEPFEDSNLNGVKYRSVTGPDKKSVDSKTLARGKLGQRRNYSKKGGKPVHIRSHVRNTKVTPKRKVIPKRASAKKPVVDDKAVVKDAVADIAAVDVKTAKKRLPLQDRGADTTEVKHPAAKRPRVQAGVVDQPVVGPVMGQPGISGSVKGGPTIEMIDFADDDEEDVGDQYDETEDDDPTAKFI